jgi:hypothetical protein
LIVVTEQQPQAHIFSFVNAYFKVSGNELSRRRNLLNTKDFHH